MDKESNTLLKISIKYILQGLAIAIAAYYVPVMYKTSLRKPTLNEILSISVIASITMFILDYFIAEAGIGAKLGAGFSIGQNLIKLI